jgi:hypothetical protein
VKEMIFWRGRASYLYSTKRDIRGSQGKLREHLGFLEALMASGKFLIPEGTSRKDF